MSDLSLPNIGETDEYWITKWAALMQERKSATIADARLIVARSAARGQPNFETLQREAVRARAHLLRIDRECASLITKTPLKLLKYSSLAKPLPPYVQKISLEDSDSDSES